MYYIASISGGVSSAVAADLAIKRFGRKKVILWFADTLAEDPDLYRFVDDLMARWGGKLYLYCDGRTPSQVVEELRIIPNQKIAPCTRILKIEPFTNWLYRVPKPVTVLLGYDWSEEDRINKRRYYHRYNGAWRRPMGYSRRIWGVYEDFPLLWRPLVYDVFDYCRNEMNIKIPQMYIDGYSNNNCGGECFRQGVGSWLLTRDTRPEKFLKRAAWEAKRQQILGTDYTILRDQSKGTVTPLPLYDLIDRKRVRRKPGDELQMTIFEDRSSCLCSV